MSFEVYADGECRELTDQELKKFLKDAEELGTTVPILIKPVPEQQLTKPGYSLSN
jgi:hypothetical protein